MGNPVPARRRSFLPRWLLVTGAAVLLVGTIIGGYALGTVYNGSSESSAASDSGDDSAQSDEDGSDGHGSEDESGDTAPDAEDGASDDGVLQGGTEITGQEIAFGLPQGWEPLDTLPDGMSLEMDSPEEVHALTRDDGTVVAYTSLTSADADEGRLTTNDAATILRTFVGPFNEGFEDHGSEPYEVPGSTDATRADMRYNTDLNGTTLCVDTGAPEFAVLNVVINEGADPTPEEVTVDDLEAILSSVTVG